MSFLNPNQRHTFLFDKVTRRPACVIIQSLHGCHKEPCYLWNEWETAPTQNFVRITATGKQIEDFAAQSNKRSISMTWRKLAREGIAVALLGQLVMTIWFFVTGDRVNRATARGIAARAVHGELYGAGIVQGGNDVWLSDGTRLTVRFCASNSDTNCREDRDHVERDYWEAYKAWRASRDEVLVSLEIGVVGFPYGLGLWVFYRLIHFAVKRINTPHELPKS